MARFDRAAVVTVAMLGACGGAPGPKGDPGPQGVAGPAGGAADTAALMAEVADLRAQLVAVKAQVAAVKPSLVPHLILRETGEDLGPFAGFDLLWNDRLQEFYSTATTPIAYESTDCTGTPYIAAGSPMLRLGSDDRIVRPVGGAAERTMKSLAQPNGGCAQFSRTSPVVGMIDTGESGTRYQTDQLTISVR